VLLPHGFALRLAHGSSSASSPSLAGHESITLRLHATMPLHAAIQSEQAEEVVSALIHAHPAAARMCDAKGWLPLELALEARLSAEVTSALTAADMPWTREGVPHGVSHGLSWHILTERLGHLLSTMELILKPEGECGHGYGQHKAVIAMLQEMGITPHN
jgi:hypothetical protein